MLYFIYIVYVMYENIEKSTAAKHLLHTELQAHNEEKYAYKQQIDFMNKRLNLVDDMNVAHFAQYEEKLNIFFKLF